MIRKRRSNRLKTRSHQNFSSGSRRPLRIECCEKRMLLAGPGAGTNVALSENVGIENAETVVLAATPALALREAALSVAGNGDFVTLSVTPQPNQHPTGTDEAASRLSVQTVPSETREPVTIGSVARDDGLGVDSFSFHFIIGPIEKFDNAVPDVLGVLRPVVLGDRAVLADEPKGGVRLHHLPSDAFFPTPKPRTTRLGEVTDAVNSSSSTSLTLSTRGPEVANVEISSVMASGVTNDFEIISITNTSIDPELALDPLNDSIVDDIESGSSDTEMTESIAIASAMVHGEGEVVRLVEQAHCAPHGIGGAAPQSFTNASFGEAGSGRAAGREWSTPRFVSAPAVASLHPVYSVIGLACADDSWANVESGAGREASQTRWNQSHDSSSSRVRDAEIFEGGPAMGAFDQSAPMSPSHHEEHQAHSNLGVPFVFLAFGIMLVHSHFTRHHDQWRTESWLRGRYAKRNSGF